jgi:bacillithiol system protein YtxJ
MQIEPITDIQQWQQLYSGLAAPDARPLLVFKRSPICPTSFAVESVFARFIRELPETRNVRVVSVDVVAARPVSQRVAADTGIRHESPQALLIGPGPKVLWHDSHGGVDEESLEKALAATL